MRIVMSPSLPQGSFTQNYAGLVLTGIVFSIYVLICDSLAVYYAFSSDSELQTLDNYEEETIHDLSKVSVSFIIALDALALLVTLSSIVLLWVDSCCEHCDTHTSNGHFQEWIMHLICLFYCCCFCMILQFKRTPIQSDGCCNHRYEYELVDLGSTDNESLTLRKKSAHLENKAWLLVMAFTAPLVCFGTHASFVIVAWSSDPADSSSMTVILTLSFFYYFFGFRQLYIVLASNACLSNTSIENNKTICCCYMYETQEAAEELRKHHKHLENFNFGAFIIEMFVGVPVLASIQAMIIITYVYLPAPVDAIPSNILNILHLALIVGSFLVAYKLLTFHMPHEEVIIEKFVDAYHRSNSGVENSGIDETGTVTAGGTSKAENPAESVGEILGGFLSKLEKKMKESERINIQPVEVPTNLDHGHNAQQH